VSDEARATPRLLQLADLPWMLGLMAVGLGLVYLFGKHLWGRVVGVIAALLLIAHPLDFAWSTIIASDILVSFVSALAILFVLRALVSYVFAGDPIAPYHAELFFQGLTGPRAVDHRMSAPVSWLYVTWLFKWNSLGNLAVVLVFSLWQCVSMASKTRAAFNDRLQACQLLATLPPKARSSDFQIPTRCAIVGIKEPEWTFPPLHSFDGAQRKTQLAAVTSGYLVTGGGREPYYGCWDCIPKADEITAGQWRLLAEFPGPTNPTPWRFEPTRVWERVAPNVAG
jgi:hypothetical protein